MTEPLLYTRDLTISFGGQTVVDHVNLDISPRTFYSIIGPNGAGKTTLFNLVSGQLLPTYGKVFFKGRDITRFQTYARTRLGMGRSFQLTNVFPRLSVLENVRLAVQAREGVHYQSLRHYRKYRRLNDRAIELLEMVSLNNKQAQTASALSHGDKRKLEFAIMLALEPEILLLDEPTAGMAVEEVPTILELINRLKQAGDKTILLVEHKIDLVLSLSDKIIVLANGKLLAQGKPQDIVLNEQVQAAYLGGMNA